MLNWKTLELQQEYEVIDICPLWEDERPPCDEMCMIRGGALVTVLAKNDNRIKVKYGKYIGWIDYEKTQGSGSSSRSQNLNQIGAPRVFNLRKKKQKKGLFSLFRETAAATGVLSSANSQNAKQQKALQDLQFIQEIDWSEEEERSFCVEDGVYHTLGICTLRAQEDLYSMEITDLPPHTRVQILQLGKSRRALVRVLDGDNEGTVAWLSLRTSFMEILVGPIKIYCFDSKSHTSRPADSGNEIWMFWNMPKSILVGKMSVYQEYEVGSCLEILMQATVYEGESLMAAAVGTLAVGSLVRVLGIGINHPFRCKIVSMKPGGSSEGLIGWVDGKSRYMDDVLGIPGSKESGSIVSSSSPSSRNQKLVQQRRDLFVAVRSGNVSKLKELLPTVAATSTSQNVVNTTDARGKTLLMHAAGMGRQNVVNFLLRYDTNSLYLNAQDDTGKTALHWAARRMVRQEDTIAIKRQINQDSSDQYGSNVIEQTILPESMKQNKDGDNQPSQQTNDNELFAKIIQTLVNAKAPVEAQDTFGNTALMYATMRNNHAGMEVLLGTGKINIERKNADGYTTFDMANIFNQRRSGELLQQYDCKDQWILSEPLQVVFAPAKHRVTKNNQNNANSNNESQNQNDKKTTSTIEDGNTANNNESNNDSNSVLNAKIVDDNFNKNDNLNVARPSSGNVTRTSLSGSQSNSPLKKKRKNKVSATKKIVKRPIDQNQNQVKNSSSDWPSTGDDWPTDDGGGGWPTDENNNIDGDPDWPSEDQNPGWPTDELDQNTGNIEEEWPDMDEEWPHE